MTFVAAASIYALLLCIAILFIVGASKANARYDKQMGNCNTPPAPNAAPMLGAQAASNWDAQHEAAWAPARDASEQLYAAAWATARDASEQVYQAAWARARDSQ